MTARVRLLSWDWRGQIDVDDLARAVFDVSDGGVHIEPVDTGSDQYGIVVSDRPLTVGEVAEVWRRHEEGEDRED